MSHGAFGQNETVIIRHEHAVQIKVPLPFPLRWVNAYLLSGSEGWTVIDPGLHTEKAVQVWESVMSELAIGSRDISRIVLTHHHPDHYGLAGWFQARTGAPVLMSQSGWTQAQQLWADGGPMSEAMMEQFRLYGLPAELDEPMREHTASFLPLVAPHPAKVTFIAPGDYVTLGDERYLAVETPGHAAGQLCFYREQSGIVFCGDHVLPKISPNVSFLPGVDNNPLGSYMASLEQVSRWNVAKAYPGHREPFHRFAERAEELIRHHRDRLDDMYALLDAPKSAYTVCRELFGDKLTLHQLRFALSETVAHLVWLKEAGQIVEVEKEAGQAGVVWMRKPV